MSEFPTVPNGIGDANILMWARSEEVEHTAYEQIRSIAQLPGLYGVRVMPDVHWGNGAAIGTVIAMEQALAPSAVGVDIGCGVNAVRTNLFLEDLDDRDLRELRKRFENAIPVGQGKHDREVDTKKIGVGPLTKFWDRFDDLYASDIAKKEADAHLQLGTLGNGNHFIELCTDDESRIWITLHSGSRGIGNLLARKHIDIAKDLPANQDLPRHLKELSLFYKNTPEMAAYLNDLHWAQDYAMISRTIMMALVKRELIDYIDGRYAGTILLRFDDEINCHHNYVSVEEIDGKELIVTRKGAISARAGELALIPGSMATGSYIVRGLGNEEGFFSASHGAGRKMSRSAAKAKFTVQDVERTMSGIEARTDAGVIDEISYAYKNLDDVIDIEKDLVEVVQKLDTVLCVKG
jgi:tRNA-splicing ligase RtcB